MTIKAMAAGRVSPYVGLTFSYADDPPVRHGDGRRVPRPEEVHEDVRSPGALERRLPNLEGRATPNKTAALGGE